MAGRQDDFLTGADFDELHSLLDGGFLDENFDLEEYLEPVVAEKTSEGQFLCERCSKTYKTPRSLSRHFNRKHHQTEAEDNFGLSREEAEVLKKLYPLQFQKIIKQSAEKCSNDQCLPGEIRQEFNGDAKNLFSSYYGLLCDNLLSGKLMI